MMNRRVFVSTVCPFLIFGVSMARGEVRLTDLGGDQYRAVFRLKAPPGTTTVHLAGTFNEWKSSALEMDGPDDEGVFAKEVTLAKGRHEYKFVLNGRQWVTDPDNPHVGDGYRNSILYVGVTSEDAASRTPPPVTMARLAKPIPALAEFEAELREADATKRDALRSKWLEEHRMPVFTDRAVAFVYHDSEARTVTLQLDAYGARTGYAMQPLSKGSGDFAVTLVREDLPERAAYAYVVTTDEAETRVLDPYAWSLTSRSGQPAGAVVAASPDRGRIEVLPGRGAVNGDLKPRDIYIYLPPGYDNLPQERYPVLYMHDGQNCWDDPTEPFGHGGWSVNLAIDRLVAEKKIAPVIVVGVSNTLDRLKEYGPGADVLSAATHPYLQFLARDVKPMIDKRYRTKPDAADTALMGSSLGGVISLQGALLMPEIFGQAACLSSAFVFRDEAGRGYDALVRKVGKVPVRLYLDSGTAGEHEDGAPATRAMVELLRSTGWKESDDLVHVEDTGAEHNERAWRARVHRPLEFMFGTQR